MKKINNVLLILFFFNWIISCKNVSNNYIEKTDSIKIFQIPLDSKVLKYDNKDSLGYFIYDKSFKKIKYINSISRFFGKYKLNKNIEIFLIEKKTEGDEHIEPIGILYSFNNNKKVDSLTIYETIVWEGNYFTRFKIDPNFKISIFKDSEFSDFDEQGKDSLIIIKDTTYYKILNNGKFYKINN